MRLAVLSDIHGNLAALEAVLADIAAEGIAMIVNLGDILSGPLQPAATADRLIALALPTIRGNHERQLLTQPPAALGASDAYAVAELGAAHRAWLAALPATLALHPDIRLVHGTPDSDLAYFLETVTPEGLRPATPDEVVQRAGPLGAGLILCGHTHVPRVVRLPDGRLIVNPGSVGLPAYADDHPWPHVVETGSPHARYAVVSRGADGWSAQLRRVAYDWETAARLAAARGRPDWAVALRTGRAGPLT
ncbi:metallophosphoesterase family protein [Novosphingobium piscinae]|uniref:Metallophosphoesterase family protein n=1 Tax=Novosphingobium piscinae TaxID=1507448 RepID=A0A7X1G1K8_9SPHN|nr:metallophosphoesterase family protein [Novosphingobium piscinae]